MVPPTRLYAGHMDPAVTIRRATAADAPALSRLGVWLGVWERNPRAVAFYENYGFTHVDEQTFVLGNDEQTDWLFARVL